MRLNRARHARKGIVFLATVWLAVVPLFAQDSSASLFPGLKWRLIGPFRAGRVSAVGGVPGDPNTFYFGTPGGGIWKTTDGGQVWNPIFDSVRVPSIGALAVAPSNTNVIYAGTGEQTKGKGIYRSNDAGKTWTNVGLQDVPYIQAIEVDPRNPDIVVVAANSLGFGILWQPLPKSTFTENRGIFRTEDGGKTWKKVYANDSNIGVVDMCSDPDNHGTLFAVTFIPDAGEGKDAVPATSDIIKSSDGGITWAPLASKGLPDKGRGRLGISVAAKTNGQRLYAIVDQGFYRSDDGGANWYQSSKDTRVIGSPYFSRIFSDPQNSDVLYVAQTSMYRSTDGGKTFEAFAGAPSGDDFHLLWIDPQNPARLFAGVDQGAIVSVDAGQTWSSWYNQPTGQFYHVSTDNQFPYRVFGAQQDSGTASVLSRSNYGQIQIQDWYSVAGFEYAFIAPDPAHSNYVYSNGWYGSVVRYDTTTGEVAILFEKGQKYRASGMPPLVFSPQDPSTLYLGMQLVLRTKDGGRTWQEISPDLTGYVPEPDDKSASVRDSKPETLIASAARHGGERDGLHGAYRENDDFPSSDPKEEALKAPPPSITALAPSPAKAGVMWAGTTNRIVQLTRDAGKNWEKVTPPDLAEPTEVLYIEPSHRDPATAYLTIGATRESTPPNVLRTHDYGKTWQKIVTGFPANEMVRVVREDPKPHCNESTTAPRSCSPLLYAGTDTGVYFSWDDGDHWQPLSLNLPPTPITDLTVHGDDLVASTFGRSLWILDDVTPLRALSPAMTTYLFSPADAVRVRWMNYQDTPFPVETPAGQNPPDGAIIDYYLKHASDGDLTLTIYDEKNEQVAQFTSNPKTAKLPAANVPEYWFAPPAGLTNVAGVNRFTWDLRYPAPLTLPYGYYGNLLEYTEYTFADHAIPGETPRQQPRGPLVAPGKYTAELRYGGQSIRQPFTVVADPRVRATQADLVAQRDLAVSITRGMKSSYDAFMQVKSVRDAWASTQKSLAAGDADKIKTEADAFNKKLDAIDKGMKTAPGVGPVNRELARLLFSVESADVRPAETVAAAVKQSCDALDKDLARWKEFNEKDLPEFNKLLGGKALPVATVAAGGCNK
jgi:photosystem II stability/assembly factor-like uncharacterized protein